MTIVSHRGDDTPATWRRPSWSRSPWFEAALLGIAYAVVSRLVMFVTSLGVGEGAVFWPGAGITLAVLALRPRRHWPALLLGVAAGEVVADLTAGFAVELSLSWALANTVEPAVGAFLLTQWRGARPDLSEVPTTLRFVVGAVLVGPAAGSLVGTLGGVVLSGDPWWPRLGRWFLGDAIGVLVIAPAILTFRRSAWRRGPRALTSLALLLVAVAVGLAPWSPSAAYGLPYLVIPLLAVVSFQAGMGGACAALAVVALSVEVTAAVGSGPFAKVEVGDPLVLAAVYLAIAAAAALLVASLTAALVDRTRTEARLRLEALTDGLTGLANRRLLEDRLEQATRRHDRRGRVAVAVVDLDGLKQVNDRYGHRAGDALIVATAQRLSAALRPGDTVARLGGDEFVVVCEALTDTQDLLGWGTRIVDAICVPLEWDGLPIPVRASVGLADATDGHGMDPALLLHRADAAMYRAKRAGGGAAVATEADLEGGQRGG